jgi:hypothetical protein
LDELLPEMAADTLLADKTFDAEERVIASLPARGKSFVTLHPQSASPHIPGPNA